MSRLRRPNAVRTLVLAVTLALSGGSVVAAAETAAPAPQATSEPTADEPSPELIAGGDALWMLDSSSVVRVDPDSGAQTHVIAVDGRPSHPVATDRALWVHVASGLQGHEPNRIDLVQIEYDLPEISARVPVIDQAGAILWSALVDGAIWTAAETSGDDDALIRVDLTAGEVTDSLEIPALAWCCLATERAIWFVTDAGEMGNIDLATRSFAGPNEPS